MRENDPLIIQAKRERMRIAQENKRKLEWITNLYLNSLIAQELIMENTVSEVMRDMALVKGYKLQTRRLGDFRFTPTK